MRRIFNLPFRLYHFIIRYFDKYPDNTFYEKIFIKKINRYKIKWNPGNKNLVLTQMLYDYSTCIKLGAAANFIASRYSSNIGLYSVITKLEDTVYKSNRNEDLAIAEKQYKRIDNLYFGGRVVHRNVFDYKDQKLINSHLAEIKGKITKKEDVLKIRIEGVRIGDLIYDTYLRYSNSPTLDIKDKFLDKIIIESLNIYFNSKELLSRFEVKALVHSYATYIHHGIIVRLCLNKNIPVYTTGSYNSLVHRVLKDYPSHSNNHFLFPDLFKNLANKHEMIDQAKKLFENRFGGGIDSATAYMKESAYSANINNELNELNWSNTVVILVHCFFDSPHIYRDLLFPDFYEWLTYTLDVLSKQPNIKVLVKPHPNGIAGNDEMFKELELKYSNTNIKFIDKKTSNLQIIQCRPRAMITAYGTAASEFAYHDIDVLTIYDNPFTGYNFTKVANSVDEYGELLTNIGDLQVLKTREKILEYYYMQHVFFRLGRDPDFLKFAKYKADTFSDDFLKDFLPVMDESYFAALDSAIKEGYELAEWEYAQVNESQNVNTAGIIAMQAV